MMKKTYEKPALLCEELCPETMLCACDIENPNLNEEWQCGYEPDDLGFKIFAESWTDCAFKQNVDDWYCFHGPVVNLFGS